MSLTDEVSSDLYFADLLLSLKHAKLRRDEHFFAAGETQGAESYWEDVTTRTGGVGRVPVMARDGAAMLELLGRYWDARGEAHLTRLLPGLEALRRQLTSAAPEAKEQATRLTDFVYPLH